MTGLPDMPPAATGATGGGRRPDPDRYAVAAAVATLPSRLSVAAGAWLLVSPFALSYSTTGAGFRAYWNDVLVGVAVIAVAAPQVASPGRLPALPPVAAALGGWLASAPFVLGFAATGGAPRAAANDVLIGVLLVLLALLGRVLGRRLSRTDLADPPVTESAGRRRAAPGRGRD